METFPNKILISVRGTGISLELLRFLYFVRGTHEIDLPSSAIYLNLSFLCSRCLIFIWAFPVPWANRKLPKNSCIYTRKFRDVSKSQHPQLSLASVNQLDGA